MKSCAHISAKALRIESMVDITIARKISKKALLARSCAQRPSTKMLTLIVLGFFKASGMKALKPTTNINNFKIKNSAEKKEKVRRTEVVSLFNSAL